MVKLEREGGRPVNRPRSWEEDKRQKKKTLKNRTGSVQEVIMSLSLSPIHLEVRWLEECAKRRKKITKVEKSAS